MKDLTSIMVPYSFFKLRGSHIVEGKKTTINCVDICVLSFVYTCKEEGIICDATDAQIAKMVHCSEKSVANSIARLCSVNALKREIDVDAGRRTFAVIFEQE